MMAIDGQLDAEVRGQLWASDYGVWKCCTARAGSQSGSEIQSGGESRVAP